MNRVERLGVYLFAVLVPVSILAYAFGYYVYERSQANVEATLQQEAAALSVMVANVARFDNQYSRESAFDYNTLKATLSQIQASFSEYAKDDLQLEYLLGTAQEGHIVFVAHSMSKPPSVPWSAFGLAVPMRKALMGKSGVIVENDYKGEKVFAAYHPVPDTPWGLVIKQPYAIHIAPFIRAATMMLSATLILSFILLAGIRIMNRRSRKMLQASEERFRQLVESTDDWVWEVDAAARYTYCSGQVTSILGYRPETMLGKTPFDFMDRDEADRVGKMFRTLMTDNAKLVNLVNKNRHQAGHVVYLLTNGSPFYTDKGVLAGYRGIDRDITKLREKQQEVERMAYYDLLTGLSNRHTCYQRLAEEIQYAELSGTL